MKSRLVLLLVMVLCINLTACGNQLAEKQEPARIITEEDKNNAVWLDREKAQDFCAAAKRARDGEVLLSASLDEAMKGYPKETVFAVAVCFSSMVSESKMENCSYSEKSDYLLEVFDEAKEGVEKEGILVHYVGGTCENYQFFYAFGTAEQLRSVTCERGVSLYIAATYQYK